MRLIAEEQCWKWADSGHQGWKERNICFSKVFDELNTMVLLQNFKIIGNNFFGFILSNNNMNNVENFKGFPSLRMRILSLPNGITSCSRSFGYFSYIFFSIFGLQMTSNLTWWDSMITVFWFSDPETPISLDETPENR